MQRKNFATASAPRPHHKAAVIPQRPSFTQAMVAAAIADLNDGRPDDAVARLADLPVADAEPETARLIGSVLLAAHATAQALAWFNHALQQDPTAADTIACRARALVALGRTGEALVAYAAAAAIGCDDAIAHFEHGTLLRAAGRLPEAVAAFDTALKLRPAYPEALRAGGSVLAGLGHTEAALRFLGEALRLAPDDRDALLDRTNMLQGLGRYAEALADYDAALALAPRQADLLVNRGVALQQLGRLAEARESFESAISADPSLAQGHLNLATALVWFGEPAAALASLSTALALRPNYAEALCCGGVALKMLGRFEQAFGAFEAALTAQPDFPHARANRGELRLLLGELEAGWDDYEDRFRAGRQDRPVLGRPVPQWNGTIPCPGTRIAVLADQGNGDIVHFARYLPLLVERGFAVTFLCPSRLHRLLAALTDRVMVTDLIPAEAEFDWQIALSSLPGAFRTGLASVPARAAYLRADPSLVSRWADRIGPDGLRIGLCWRGSQNWQADPRRSLPLDTMLPLAAQSGVRLFSLQRLDDTGADEALMAALAIDALGAELDRGPDAFCDTAAAMDSLDLVVTCDTSIAHLAGALGRPVFVLLQSVPEWRWLLDRADSPWYPSMRLFRQTRSGDWREPVLAMVEAVRQMRDEQAGENADGSA